MKSIILVLITIILVGCTTGRNRGYMNKDDDVFGHASRLEYTQKRIQVVKSIERLLTDAMFTENYAKACIRAQEAGRSLPTITISPIENNTGDGRSDSEATGQIYNELQTAIRKTGKFVVIDRIRRKQMTNANIVANNDGEDSAVLQGIGAYMAADFVMVGALRREFTDDEDRKVYHHFLNLEMMDAITGTVFWSDELSIVKYDAR